MTGVLTTKTVEKPWGRDSLPLPFAAPKDKRIGEIWFEAPPPLDDLLAKYLFTSEKLSVQVHPDNARAPGGTRGKEECWLVLAAEPGAQLAIGFERELSTEELRAAALDGSVEELLTWHDVAVGDFFYLPAGTVHAIGAGLVIAELQQNSDTTYRLFDYGRPRELHLDEALAVANRGVYRDPRRRHVAPDEPATLVDGPFFRIDHVTGEADLAALADYYRAPLMILPLRGEAVVGDGVTVKAGECGWADSVEAVRIARSCRALLFSAA